MVRGGASGIRESPGECLYKHCPARLGDLVILRPGARFGTLLARFGLLLACCWFVLVLFGLVWALFGGILG